jgi:hypothetical protein
MALGLNPILGNDHQQMFLKARDILERDEATAYEHSMASFFMSKIFEVAPADGSNWAVIHASLVLDSEPASIQCIEWANELLAWVYLAAQNF